jgi:hypothetical protein
MKWYPRACPTCSGDLFDDVLDRGWLTCMMCSRSFEAVQILGVRRLAPSEPPPMRELSEAA